MFNAELGLRILDHIKAHPEEWDQEVYGRATACGSAFCVAGHAAVMTGAAFRAVDLSFVRDGDVVHPADDGALALGLDPDSARAYALFDGLNSLERVEALIRAFAADPEGDEIPAGL